MTQSIQVDNGAFKCHASVDCTDIPICEPSPFSPSWMSHKFKSAGLRYEVSISLDGHIVWCNGPYPAGIRNDLQIYRDTLRQKLSHREVIVGDSAYLDPACVYDDGIDDEVAQSLRNRQETVFSKMKSFNVLGYRFRHDISKHNLCFYAIANLLEIGIQNGDTLFQINDL